MNAPEDLRLQPALRNGLTNEILSWFIECAGMPGDAIEPRLDSYLAHRGSWDEFAHSVICTAQRTPYSPIGDYMDRWWFMPEVFGERARVHRTMRSDHDRHRHDHPWHFVSIILATGYTEEIETNHGLVRQLARPGDVLFRHAHHRHRLELEPSADCWSLVFTAPKSHDWGFYTETGFVPWQQYKDALP